MRRVTRRINVLSAHLNGVKLSKCVSSAVRLPTLTVTPTSCLVDEKIHIKMTGLPAHQLVTLVANVTENEKTFESRCLYQADASGMINNRTSPSLGGSFKGIDEMGLFSSITAIDNHRTRMIKKDVTVPIYFKIQAYEGDYIGVENIEALPVTEVVIKRSFMKKGVQRIPVSSGGIVATIFVPEGEGPFPGVVDMFGGLVSLIETRAALLASHGYATLALSYLYAEGLPTMIVDADISYITNAYERFSNQPYVDKSRLGAVGLCLGGFMSLCLTALLPKVKAVVNVNGISMIPDNSSFSNNAGLKKWLGRPKPDLVYNTPEGVVVNRVYDCQNVIPVPAWQHGAEILIIVGEDDKQVHPKWHTFFYDNCPPKHKHQIEMHRYEGAGHLIEPPYMPHIRTAIPGRKRMQSVNFIPDDYHDEPMMSGGFAKEHAHAQEESWEHILNFLQRTLKSP